MKDGLRTRKRDGDPDRREDPDQDDRPTSKESTHNIRKRHVFPTDSQLLCGTVLTARWRLARHIRCLLRDRRDGISHHLASGDDLQGVSVGARDVLVALGRRWYIVVLGFALTAGAAWYVYDANPPEYSARGLVLLLPPDSDADAGPSNPFLQLGGLDLTARVLVATYSTSSFEDEIAEVSPTAEVEVGIDESTRGGVVSVTVTDASADLALTTLSYALATVPERMAELQSEVGVAASASVTSMMLAVDTEAEADTQSLTRLLVVVIGGGVGVTLLIALMLDSLLTRNRRRGTMNWTLRRRDRRKRGTADDEGTPDPEEFERDDDLGHAEGPLPARHVSEPSISRRAVPGASTRRMPPA